MTNSVLTMPASQTPSIPDGAHVMTATIELPPGDSGTPPHRHSGPVFGYMLDGEMIHYQAANNLADASSRLVVVMLCAPGREMLTFVGPDEPAARADRRRRR
ncbi:MAG: hypothetical protein QOI78_7321 [Actinomycetota bacterium]|jgi:hypothetical protein|nr:hypothetical protein [Actinomycetota bacterium]